MDRLLSHFFLILLLLSPLLAWSDGGTLRHQKSAQDYQILPPAGVLSQASVLVSTQQVKIRLDDSVFDAFIVNMPVEELGSLFVMAEKPYSILLDRNQNNRFERDEILEGMCTKQGSVFRYHELELPLRIGAAFIPLVVDFQFDFQQGKLYYCLKRILNHYYGTITLNGEAMPACITIPLENYNKYHLLLDTNRDRIFNPVEDVWGVVDGAMYYKDALWITNTRIEGETAEVNLDQYVGDTGTLKIDGSGMCYVSLNWFSEKTAIPRAFEIHLSPVGNQTYLLPTGSYGLNQVAFRSGTQTAFYRSRNQAQQISLKEDQTAALAINGPVQAQLTLNRFTSIFNEIRINHSGYMDKEKQPLEYVDLGETEDSFSLRNRPQAPAWEVVNSRGRVVRTGRFEYG